MKVRDLPDNEDICKYLLQVPPIIKQLINQPIDSAYLVCCSDDGTGIYISPDPPTSNPRKKIEVAMVPTNIFQWEIVDSDNTESYENINLPTAPPDVSNQATMERKDRN